jgi:TusA-related sulfurtransferase
MNQTVPGKVIDGRGLEPPEPFVRTMAALNASAAGERVLLILSREPYPLYQALDAQGFSHQTRHAPDGTVEILSWRNPE